MRNITKIRRSIRAISPVISILLMIAIAVVASIVAYAWVMGYLGFQTEKAGNEIQIQSYTSGGNLVIYVQNTGQGVVHLKQDGSVYVNDVLKGIVNLDDIAVASGAKMPIAMGQTVKVEVDYQNFQAGDKIRVVTVEGTVIDFSGHNSGSGSSGSGSNGPSAGFLYTGTPVIHNEITFTDKSIPGKAAITSWLWDFDGTTKTTQHTTYTYDTSGDKTISLTVTDANGRTSKATLILNIAATTPTVTAPIAEFTITNIEPIVNQNVPFKDASTAGSGIINQWSWTFGDGGVSTEQNPIHAYSTIGTKTITLKVTDSNAKTSTVSHTLTVTDSTTPTPTSNPSSSPTPTPVPDQNKLVFVAGAPQNLQINTPSAQITIQRQDLAGTPVTTGSTSVTLSATAGSYYSDAACTTQITTALTIGQDASTVSFYYKCATAGTQTLTATGPTGYTAATTTFIVTTQAPTTYTVTYTVNNPTYGTVNPSGTVSTYTYGASESISASPKNGYVFQSWTRTGDILIANEASPSTTATIQGDGTITANFKAQSTDKLVFTTGTKQYIELNQVSTIITVQRQTQSGTAITTGTTTIQLVSTASGGKFYSNSGATNQITTLTISGTSSSATFYYKDSSTGTPVLTASATDFATASTYFNVNTRCTGFDGANWYYGFSVGSQPPWYSGIGEGVDGTNCAKSDPYGINSGAFTANSLDTSQANTITISFMYKVENTEDNDFQIFYSVATDPNLNQDSPDFIRLATLSAPGNNDWNTYSATFTRANNPSMFDPTFWFRLQSDLEQDGGIIENVWVDNVVISVT